MVVVRRSVHARFFVKDCIKLPQAAIKVPVLWILLRHAFICHGIVIFAINIGDITKTDN